MIRAFESHVPALAPTVRVAESAAVIGQVTLAEQVSVWYGAVLRGDDNSIQVGAGSNIQDNAVLHNDPEYPLVIGRDVTIGHSAVVHGCTVGDHCLIGMGAVLLNGCEIGAHCIVAAGALVTQHKVIPPGSMVMGAPAKVVRPLTQEEQEAITHSAEEYRRMAQRHFPACGAGPLPPSQGA